LLRGIGRVLNVAIDADSSSAKQRFKYLHLELHDVEDQSIRPSFTLAFEFLDEARKADEAVLVHCVQGISRSASFVIAYLMYARGWNLKQALTHTRERRKIVSPNRGFLKQLCDYEVELFGGEPTLKLRPWQKPDAQHNEEQDEGEEKGEKVEDR